jgi:hypothetical protein
VGGLQRWMDFSSLHGLAPTGSTHLWALANRSGLSHQVPIERHPPIYRSQAVGPLISWDMSFFLPLVPTYHSDGPPFSCTLLQIAPLMIGI